MRLSFLILFTVLSSLVLTSQAQTITVAPKIHYPVNMQTGVSIALNISWSRINLATNYRLQILKNDSLMVVDTIVNDTIFRFSSFKPLKNATNYSLKIAGKNASGTGPFSTKVIFTTEPAYTPIPTPVSPVGNYEIPAGQSSTQINFLWNASQTATSYFIQVSLKATFDTLILISDSVFTNSKQSGNILFSANKTYYWRVLAKGKYGTSNYSGTQSFTVVSKPLTLPAPIIRTPANGTLDVSLNPTLKWSFVSGAKFYNLIVTDSITQNIVIDTIFKDTTHTFYKPLSLNKIYIWQVRATTDSMMSAYTFASFKTKKSTVKLPSPLFPAENATNVILTPFVRWTRAVPSSLYSLHFYSYPDTSSIFSFTGISDTSFQVPAGKLLPSKNYKWYVVSENNYSGTFTFTTISGNTPIAPSPVTPKDTVFSSNTNVTLNWTSVPNAQSYCIEVSKDSNFVSGTTKTCGIISPTYKVPTNALHRQEVATEKFYWRVAAVNASGQGLWTAKQSFITNPVITSLDDLTNTKTSGKFFPNPFQDKLEFSKPNVLGISLNDMQGKLMLETSNNSLSTAEITSGIYMAEVVLTDGTRQTFKVIKK